MFRGKSPHQQCLECASVVGQAASSKVRKLSCQRRSYGTRYRSFSHTPFLVHNEAFDMEL